MPALRFTRYDMGASHRRRQIEPSSRWHFLADRFFSPTANGLVFAGKRQKVPRFALTESQKTGNFSPVDEAQFAMCFFWEAKEATGVVLRVTPWYRSDGEGVVPRLSRVLVTQRRPLSSKPMHR